MNGGAGDDLFYVDGADDGVFENFGEGTDTVRTFIDDVVLPQNVENGIIQNTGVGLALFGNSLDNVLTGNKFDDILWGGDRNDTLRGGAGDDTLDGGSGFDAMFGRQGNDTYLVDHVGDTVVEVEGQGTDTVYVAVPGYTLPDDVENGTIDNPGFNTFDLHGNSLGNFLVGDNVANYLVGGDGADILQGFDGGDSLDGGTGDDILDGGGWYDVLNGGAGADAMIGGSGLDTFLYSNVSDSTPASHDQIADFESTNSEPWDDQLDLSGIDADTAQAGDQAFSSLSQTPTAHGVWVTATTNSDGSWDYIIYGDVSGDTAADLEIHLHSLNGFLWQDDITM